jgi:hypothetical protein
LTVPCSRQLGIRGGPDSYQSSIQEASILVSFNYSEENKNIKKHSQQRINIFFNKLHVTSLISLSLIPL